MSRLGEMIQTYLDAHPDTTSKQLADKAGVSAQTMSGWLNHPISKRFPDPEHMQGLADALGVSPASVVDAISADLGWDLTREQVRPDMAVAVATLNRTPPGSALARKLTQMIVLMADEILTDDHA